MFGFNSKLPENSVVGIAPSQLTILTDPRRYKQHLLSLIEQAKQRIFITALYLQDDDAGREVLHALYQAKQLNPTLNIKLFVDYHRAQRGLIGAEKSLGNRAMYLDVASQYKHNIQIYGVPVKRKELFGVLHLKGMVFDNSIVYSGASINNVYLYQQDKYRIDRYYTIQNEVLADSFVNFLQHNFVESAYVPKINQHNLPENTVVMQGIKKLKAILKKADYSISNKVSETLPITIKPYVGFGKRDNKLNQIIVDVIDSSLETLVIFTPYFNLPKVLLTTLKNALKRGVIVTIVVGDKTANDFYLPPEETFTTIGIIPYLYEQLLRRFVKKYQRFVDSEQLNIRLWRDGKNSYHLKGLVVDDKTHVITGSNLNPRAWGLDIENGLLIQDPKKLLVEQWHNELSTILVHTQRLSNFANLDTVADYPTRPKQIFRRMHVAQIDRLLKKLL